MKKKSLRILSLIVAIVMVVAMLPLSALAEETGPKRRVGVAVYGSELTAILTDVESAIHGQGDLENAIQHLTAIATEIVDGTGVSVPEVDVTLTGPDGRVYQMEEDDSINIFTETTDTYIGVQNVLDEQLTTLENDIKDLQTAMELDGGLAGELSGNISKMRTSLENLKTQLVNLKDILVEGFNKTTKINGILYRTYVTDAEGVKANQTYTVTVKGFVDKDENNNPITRDGYILYNDGLGTEGSSFNSARTFTVEVAERGRFDPEIQFVGPGIGNGPGIEGALTLPTFFTESYNNFANAFNDIMNKLKSLKHPEGNNPFKDWAKDFIEKGLKIENTMKWFNEWTQRGFSLPNYDESWGEYHFFFKGLWCAEVDAGFTFKNVDVSEQGIEGSEFLLINRQELIDVLKLMKDLGKEAFEGALKATFGGDMDYTYQEETISYEGITDLYAQLISFDENRQLNLDYETAYAIVKTYIGVIGAMNLVDWVAEKDTSGVIPTYKLKYPIPAILQATSDKDGNVTFSKSNNKTLTWMLEIIPELQSVVNNIQTGNEILDMLIEVNKYLEKVTREFADIADKVINLFVYPFAQRLGLVGPKLASGEYIMFQTKAAEGYWVNPIAYTMDITWHSEGTTNEDWYYSTVADMGLIGPYFAEGFYDFVRDTTFAGTIDKFLGQATGKDVNVVSKILNGKIDVTTETSKVAMSALTAFATQIGFKSLGADKLFATKSDLLTDLNKYLIQNGQTAQNLMVYLNRLAIRSKTVYTGKVDDGWYFYNIDKSPTMTATKMIKKSTDDLVKATAVEVRKPIIQKTGDTVREIVAKVGARAEETAQRIQTKIQETVGQAIKAAAQRVFDSVKTSIVDFFKGLFNRA
ncbi:MAG: hypothetical protein IIZ65_01350 [Clostridia bacterium]|nr:hypothetical protein [Clostridia bacterium]